jgi:hypothetical protein
MNYRDQLVFLGQSNKGGYNGLDMQLRWEKQGIYIQFQLGTFWKIATWKSERQEDGIRCNWLRSNLMKRSFIDSIN